MTLLPVAVMPTEFGVVLNVVMIACCGDTEISVGSQDPMISCPGLRVIPPSSACY